MAETTSALKKKITLIPIGGVPERIRAVASAVALARKYERPLEIIWFADEELYCPSYRLFTFAPMLEDEGITIRQATTRDWFFNDRPHLSNAYFSLLFIFFRYDRYLSPKKVSALLNEGNGGIEAYFKGNERLLMATGDNLGECPEMYKVLEPTFEAMNAFRSKVSGWDDNVVGIRLHRVAGAGDNLLQQTPTDLFITRMQRMIEDDPTVRFFIASDFAEERERLATIFGERIYVPYTLSTRSTSEGCINGFGELLALSRTRRILTTKNSSFAQVASQMGQIPLETISIYSHSQSAKDVTHP